MTGAMASKNFVIVKEQKIIFQGDLSNETVDGAADDNAFFPTSEIDPCRILIGFQRVLWVKESGSLRISVNLSCWVTPPGSFSRLSAMSQKVFKNYKFRCFQGDESELDCLRRVWNPGNRW